MATSVSNVTKHFPSAQNGFTTTTASSTASGATTVQLNSVAGYNNGEVAVFVIEPTSSTAKQTFTGTIDTSGVQVTNVVWTSGTNQTHASGVTVVDYETATHWSMMTKGILVNHDQGGNHKSLTDTNGNTWIGQTATASAVNYLDVANSATGNNVILSPKGSDTNISLELQGKGSGSVVLPDASITSEKLQATVAFRAQVSTTFNYTAGVDKLVEYDSEIFDVGGDYDNTSGNFKFTAPVTGYYQINASAAFGIFSGLAGDLIAIRLYLNGSQVEILNAINAGGSNTHRLIGSTFIKLNASDYLQVYCTNTVNNGTITNGFFSGFLVGQ